MHFFVILSAFYLINAYGYPMETNIKKYTF